MESTTLQLENQVIPGNAEERPGLREPGRGRLIGEAALAVPFGGFLQDKLVFDLRREPAEGPAEPLLDTYKQPSHAFDLPAKTARKRRSRSLAARIEIFDPARAARMRNCGRRFSLAVSKCPHHHTVALKTAVSFNCEDRLCPECARRRSARLVGRLSEPLRRFQAGRGLFASFVTLTLGNTEELPAMADLTKWRKRLLRSPFWREYGLIGTVGALEVKLGEGSGKWHVHFHFVAFTGRPVPLIQTGEHAGKWEVSVNQGLSAAWMKANEGAGFIVRGIGFDGHYREILKYIGKGFDAMSDRRLEEFCRWSRGRRFLFVTGQLYANPELKALIEEERAQREGAAEAKPECCPECGCCDFERIDFVFDNRLRQYVVEKVSEFQFNHTE